MEFNKGGCTGIIEQLPAIGEIRRVDEYNKYMLDPGNRETNQDDGSETSKSV